MSEQGRKTIKVSEIVSKRNHFYEVKASSYSFLLDENSFTNHFLYVGKELDHEEIKRLKEESATSELSSYAISLLSRKRYSKHELKERLLKKNPSTQAVFATIKQLEQYSLIDDASYAYDYKEEKERALYGKKRILDELRYKKGISPTVLSSLSFLKEKENAKRYVELTSRSYSSLPYLSKKKKMQSVLERRGFEEEAIAYALNGISKEETKLVEERFEKVAKAALERYLKRYNSSYELKGHLYAYLKGKGYSVSQIESFLERNIG